MASHRIQATPIGTRMWLRTRARRARRWHKPRCPAPLRAAPPDDTTAHAKQRLVLGCRIPYGPPSPSIPPRAHAARSHANGRRRVRVGECIVPCYSCASMTRHREAAQQNRRVDLERLADPIISPGLPRSVTPAAMCLARPKYRAKSKPHIHPSIHPSSRAIIAPAPAPSAAADIRRRS